MVNNNLPTLIEDEHQIASLLVRWGHARDSDDWETLAACFDDDATIHISWISASAKDYIARSRAMAGARKPGEHSKHLISAPWIQINRDRAFSRCHVNLYIRTTLTGHEFDLQSWFRFFDLLKRRDSVWRIFKRTAVYEKDRLEAVDPRGVPKGFFEKMELSAFPASSKFLCYWQLSSGRLPSTDIISVYSDKERALRGEGERWLESA
jgi:3-phenylpropionate/cinnamic acid dioxygenase small subunit